MTEKKYKNLNFVCRKFCSPARTIFQHYKETISNLFLSIWLSIWDTINRKTPFEIINYYTFLHQAEISLALQ